MNGTGKITASSGVSIALMVVLVGLTWNARGVVQDLRNEMDQKYVSQAVASVRFKGIEDRLDDIYYEIRELRRLHGEAPLEGGR